MTTFTTSRTDLTIDGVTMGIAATHRSGSGVPILFLHGFGSTKEDYTDIAQRADLADHPFLAIDAPGCGQSTCDDLSKISIPLLVKVALSMADDAGFNRFHLVGHSMGGLTGLLLAHQQPERVVSFTDIEGNIAPEDCFLSRQIVDFAADDDDEFFDGFIERARFAPAWASALYAASLRHKVRAGAVRGIFTSMVELSDNADLMGKFLGLACPRMFMFGDQNDHLSYLASIEAAGVRLSKIPSCGHFPMYSNPMAMWDDIADFQAEAEIGDRGSEGPQKAKS